eukprot:TRINITY_DN20627_c0_g1_i1.p1 TRINITY_DN20627_c0_g1~~TRINITY_DN20627_c0_g1_i1.p1  ORF type:complete len:260 (+),score=51.68 TRINITY_DN20627_c0_g1_i1:121-900(+)
MGCGASAGYAIHADGEEDRGTASRSSKSKKRKKKLRDEAPKPPRAPAGPRDYWELVGLLRGCARVQACRRLAGELEGMLKDLRDASRGDAASGGCLFAAPCEFRHSGAGPEGEAAASSAELLEWDALLCGPEGTPYEGGTFYLRLCFPASYPHEPPVARFVTPVWHPNIDADTGKICLNVLAEEWDSLLTTPSLLMCISALLAQPDPEDPLNHQAAEMIHFKPREFVDKARRWTERHANEAGPLDFILLLAQQPVEDTA